ncbi:MAG: hypothetical protein CFE45_13245 [Burkholderiales bacterium PBB5]|nr:MAG: hypothetical protein CFE45_13245 [Burkholderiales bacterium PBB5]
MANGNATLAAAERGIGAVYVGADVLNGSIRPFFSRYTVPATGGPAIGEVITWGRLPIGARVLFGLLTCSAGAASSTINLGDAESATRYMAATSVASAGNSTIVPATIANGGAGFIVQQGPAPKFGPATVLDQGELRSVVAGAALAGGQTIDLLLFFSTP